MFLNTNTQKSLSRDEQCFPNCFHYSNVCVCYWEFMKYGFDVYVFLFYSKSLWSMVIANKNLWNEIATKRRNTKMHATFHSRLVFQVIRFMFCHLSLVKSFCKLFKINSTNQFIDLGSIAWTAMSTPDHQITQLFMHIQFTVA